MQHEGLGLNFFYLGFLRSFTVAYIFAVVGEVDFFCGCFRCRCYILVALVPIPCGRLIVGNSFAVVDAFVLRWFPADVIAWLRMLFLGYVL